MALMNLVKNTFMLLLARYRCVPPSCRAFATSTRVARSTKHSEFTIFAPSCGLRYNMVSSKFTRTGNPVRRPFVALTYQPIGLDVTLDELLASCDSFSWEWFSPAPSHNLSLS